MSYLASTDGQEPMAKKYVRAFVWLTIYRAMGEAFRRAALLYFAGPDGGDASATGGLNHPRHLQLAVERCASAADNFALRYPQVPLFVGDISSLRERFFDVVFLDFCGHVEASAMAIMDGFRRMSRFQVGWFAVALLKGREQDYARNVERLARASRGKRALRDWIRTQGGVSPAGSLGLSHDPDVVGDGVYKATARLREIDDELLLPVAIERRTIPVLRYLVTYRGTEHSPMLVAMYQVEPCPELSPAEALRRYAYFREHSRFSAIDLPTPTVYDAIALVEDSGVCDSAGIAALLNESTPSIRASLAVRTRRRAAS